MYATNTSVDYSCVCACVCVTNTSLLNIPLCVCMCVTNTDIMEKRLNIESVLLTIKCMWTKYFM